MVLKRPDTRNCNELVSRSIEAVLTIKGYSVPLAIFLDPIYAPECVACRCRLVDEWLPSFHPEEHPESAIYDSRGFCAYRKVQIPVQNGFRVLSWLHDSACSRPHSPCLSVHEIL